MIRVVVVDFETYWSSEHSLTKMSPLAYVTHPDTDIISMAIKDGTGPTLCYFGEENIQRALDKAKLTDALLVGHNMSGFDSLILAWRFNVRPRMWGCTLAMARPLHAKTCGLSLAKLVAHYHLGVKDATVLHNTKGKRLADFTTDELQKMVVYNSADTEQCAQLFHLLKRHYTAAELWHIDATVRMLVEPAFRVNVPMLETAASIERTRKLQALFDLATLLGVEAETRDEVTEAVREQLASALKFSTLLERRGVPTPMKPSPTNPDKQVPALAKTDEAFLALREHDDPIVAAAASARLDVKSTLLETRIQLFLDAATAAKGRLPVPLKYAGADTTGRWSGEQYNPQNLPRIPRDKSGNIVEKNSNVLRLCMQAPPGHQVVVADLSGIELRVNHFLWKVPSSMRLFQNDPAKADLYRDFASRLYDVPEAEVTKDQRQIGKVAHLGLGFGAGPTTFRNIARLMGGVDMDLAQAQEITYRWREEYAPIVEGWKHCHRMLTHILMGDEQAIDPWGLTRTCKEGIRLPSGRIIRYPALRKERTNDRTEWFYGTGRNEARIYAGKIDENCVQALARDCIADNALEVYKLTKRRPALCVHDELIYVVPKEEAQGVLDTVQQVMRTAPHWWPELITWSEGDLAQNYGEAK